MRVPHAVQFDVSAANLPDQLLTLPGTSGIYALESPGHAPHLSWSSNLQRRLLRLLTPRSSPNSSSPHSSSATSGLLATLRKHSAVVRCWPTSSRLETALLMYSLAKIHFPREYLQKLRLRMPWFVTLTAADSFPRMSVVNRIPTSSALLLGPFLTRDLAQQYEEETEGLFQIRRCVEVLQPSPEHPGCIYGEMNHCLRPCQCAVTPEEYGSEAQRASDFLATNGKNLIGTLVLARDRAAEATDFEQAAYLHKRIERVKATAAIRDPVVSNAMAFNGIALTRAAGPRRFQLWPMLHASWQEPLTLDVGSEEARARSLDAELRERLTTLLASPAVEANPLEHLAIFSRWYYSSWRDGHWFPFRTLPDLNYRKLVREISNMAKMDGFVPAPVTPC